MKFIISRNKVVFTVYTHQMLSRIREDMMLNREKKIVVADEASITRNATK